MEKHAFRGNEKGLKVHVGSSSGNRGRGRRGPRGSHGEGGGGRGGGAVAVLATGMAVHKNEHGKS
jgi:hypothetical protein